MVQKAVKCVKKFSWSYCLV